MIPIVLFFVTSLSANSTLQFDGATKRFTFAAPEASFQQMRMGVEVDGEWLWSTEATADIARSGEVDLRFPNAGISWSVRVRHMVPQQTVEIESVIRNTGAQPARIGRVVFAEGGTITGFGEQTRALVMTGWTVLPRVRLLKNPQISKTFAQLYDPSSRAAANIGFLTFDRAETVVELTGGARPGIRAFCDLAGFPLAPNATIRPEIFRLAIQTDPQAGLEEWANRAAETYHPRIWSGTPSGWVGWSWVDPFHIERYEDVVRRNAEAVRRRLPGLDIDYLWVSLGNLKDRIPGNWLKWNYDSFPSGPEKLSADLKAKGFQLGLWAGAFWMNEKLTDGMDRLNGAFLQYKGQPVVVPHRMLGKMYVPDPTHPKTQSFLREVFETWRKWGVRYYMIDFLYAITGATPGTFLNDGYYDKTRIQGPEAWREGLRVIREAAGSDTYLLTSTGPTMQSIGYMDAVRTSSDYGEGRPLDGPGIGFYPATFVINKPDFWTSHREGVGSLATSSFLHRKLFLTDSGNVLTVDQPLPMSEAQIATTIFGLNGGPLMLGDDIARMSDDRLEMIKRVFPRMTDAARSLDLFDAPDPDYPKLFHLKVKLQWSEWDLLAVFNLDKTARHQTVDLARLGLKTEFAHVAWDFWDQRYLGAVRDKLELDVLPNTVRLIRLEPARPHPWLLSTDLHVRQGQAEIEDCRWDDASSTLTIRARRPIGSKGSIFVRAPQGWAMAKPAGLWIAKDGNDNALIIRSVLDFQTPVREVRLAFQKLP